MKTQTGVGMSADAAARADPAAQPPCPADVATVSDARNTPEPITPGAITPVQTNAEALLPAPNPGLPDAGGVVSTLHDQLAFGHALDRSTKVLDADSLAHMLDIDNQSNTALGAFPTCPWSTVNGVKIYSPNGHNGGRATVQYAPKQNVVIAVNLTESRWTADLTQADVAEPLTSVEQAVNGT